MKYLKHTSELEIKTFYFNSGPEGEKEPEISAAAELLKEQLTDEEIKAKIQALVDQRGEEETHRIIRATLEEDTENTELTDQKNRIREILKQRIVTKNREYLEAEKSDIDKKIQTINENFSKLEPPLEPSQTLTHEKIIEDLEWNNQAMYASKEEAQKAITEYLDNYEKDEIQGYKENLITEAHGDTINTAAESLDTGRLKITPKALTTALAQNLSIDDIKSLTPEKIQDFVKQFETNIKDNPVLRDLNPQNLITPTPTETRDLSNAVTQPNATTTTPEQGKDLLTTLLEALQKLLKELFGSSTQGDTTTTSGRNYTGEQILNDNIEGIETNSSVVNRALNWVQQGRAGVKGARHCTHWVEKVFFGEGTTDGSKIHSLPKAINYRVNRISSGTGIGSNGGAGPEEVDKLPPGSHIMIDHCRNGQCNQGKTHSAILLSQPSNGVARVASYPGNGKPPRIETYTMTANGAGNSKKVIRAHHPPS